MGECLTEKLSGMCDTCTSTADQVILGKKISKSVRFLKKHKRLRSIRNNTLGSPVTQHFNSTGHSISDVQVHGVALCRGTNIQRKQCEMRLI